MNWTMIILAAGLTALGLALVLLAVFLKRDGHIEPQQPESEQEPAGGDLSPGAFIDEPLETDMSAVLLGSAPFSATGTSLAVDLTVDRDKRLPEEEPAPSEKPEAVPVLLEWEEAIPAALFEEESGAPGEPDVQDTGGEETIEVELPQEEVQATAPGQALMRSPLRDDQYSWQIRRDAPILGAAAGIAVAASLIGYAVGRRRRKSS